MATYAIGDIQGCYSALQCLLQQLSFDAKKDRILLAGDLVNRGPESLECLRFIKSLGKSALLVLGNHDLHLLAVAHGVREARAKDTLQAILTAPDRIELLNWLQTRPLLHTDKKLNIALVHAGIPHIWSIPQAKALAQEVEHTLQNGNAMKYFTYMYGNTPDSWQPNLEKWERLRVITNYLTRMRVCNKKGVLDLSFAGEIENCPENFYPWFTFHKHQNDTPHIYFGHWAAINGVCNHPNITALDTGCVWGNKLTAINLKSKKIYQCNC